MISINNSPYSDNHYLFRLLIIGFSLVLLSTLTIRTFFPFQIVAAGIVISLFVLYYLTLGKKDLFGFIIIILFLSFFQFSGAQGGSFNISAFLLLVLHLIRGKKILEFKSKDSIITLLGFVFITSNFLGYLIKFNSSLINLILGATSFLGFILVFITTSNLKINESRFSILIQLLIWLSAFSLLVSINKFFNFFYSPLPLFGGEGRWGSSNIGGTFGASPISGEWGLLLYVLLLPLFFSDHTQKLFKLKYKFILFGLVISLLTILIAASRSTIILTAIYTVIYIVYFLFRHRNIFNRKSNLAFGFPIAIFIVFMTAPLLNWDYLVERFVVQLNPAQISLASLQTGEGINRTVAFDVGRQMLERENWLIGYGWGIPEDNRLAWFGTISFLRSDPHSLYLSLPMLFGWAGSAAIILLLPYLIIKLKIVIDKAYKGNYYLFIPASGFFFLIIFFIINEYKMTALGYNHYTMVIVIMLGFSNAIIKTYESDRINTLKRRYLQKI